MFRINFGAIPPIFNHQIFLVLFGAGLRGWIRSTYVFCRFCVGAAPSPSN